MTQQTNPAMSEQEASWHQAMAGLRAKQAAQQDGAAPSAIAALLASSVKQGVTIGPITLRPATKGTGLTLTELGEAFQEWRKTNPIPEAQSDIISDGIAAIIFMDSEDAYCRFQADGIEPFITEAWDLHFSLGIDAAAKINEHVNKQLETIHALAAANGYEQATAEDSVPGKPQETPGTSSEPATVRPETTSPSSSGSCPNTTSPSMPRSGSSPQPQPSSCCPPATNATAETPDPATAQTHPSPPVPGAVNG